MRGICLVLLIAVIVESDYPADGINEDNKELSEEELKGLLLQSNMNFAVNIYKQVASSALTEKKSQPKNIFFSPVSIATSLAMLALGAKAETRNQILNSLAPKETRIQEDKIHNAFRHFLQVLNKPKKDLKITIGNAAFVEDELNILKSFANEAESYYQADVFPTNFKNPKEAERQINNYVKNKTNGKIKELVRGPSTETNLLLVNYILFKGEWEYPFSPDFTRLSMFSIDNNTKVEVKMMSRMGRYDIYLDNEVPCTVLKLPYTDDALMLLIMPKLGQVEDVEAALSKDTILRWRNSTSKKFLRLYMPKFSISSSLKLKEIFSDMGMNNMFSDQADFSGIVEDGKLKLSKVIHKAVLDVDEKGTEAAAVTAVNVIRYSLLKSQKVDRPFLVVICSKETDTILFIGRIVNPTDM
ncbi:serine protease inhibitor A6 [Xenopus laevis]|uniref:Serine protease inhibitor A6 n=2 Tax=Xenopus laevis TaxID=8355 RepID=A0A1L8F9L2_XENLA|nr:serine protease inhibitor A6 [Xenopus laevis]OCT68274.1 hypothetical protein XELAEV_18039572mg [Xenopus laevis]